jgi:hypothetical protein
MADRDLTDPDMTDRDELRMRGLRERLDGVAASIDAGEPELARTAVDDVVGRRRARKRLGVVLGAAAVVAVAATTVVVTLGGDEPDTLVTSDDTMPADTVADDGADVPTPTFDLPVATAQPVELIEGAAGAAVAAGASGAPEYGEWIVPWDDGFLVGSMSFPPQPLPTALPEEVVALFPQEVIDLFGGDLPDTISEATEQLSAAGLLDEVSEIIQANPAASDAIYGAPTEAPTLDVRFTVDGVTWEPRAVVSPPGATYLSGVTSVGDRLAVVYGILDPLSGAPLDSTVTVATTTDLTNWSTQDIVVPSPGELPEGITWRVYAQGLVANDDGWVVSVSASIDADPFALLPADVRDEIDGGNGLGMSTDGVGVTIEYGFDSDGNDPTGTRTFTWDELGVAPEVAQLIADQDYAPTLWAASWDGEPIPTDAPPIGGPIAATPAGFVQWTDQTWFSPDGITWTASPLPDDATWVTGAFNVEGGLIVLSSSTTGEALVHRVDELGENAVLLDLPVPASSSVSTFASASGSVSSAMVVALDPVREADQQLSVEVDGYRLTMLQPAGLFEVVEVATGDVVVSENPFGPGSEDSNIVFDDTGVTVTDPDTGEVVVVFPSDVMDAAESEFFDAGRGEYQPDLWVLASLDGERFVVDDIDDSIDGPTSLATNGSRLLLQSGGNWITYDLG